MFTWNEWNVSKTCTEQWINSEALHNLSSCASSQNIEEFQQFISLKIKISHSPLLKPSFFLLWFIVITVCIYVYIHASSFSLHIENVMVSNSFKNIYHHKWYWLASTDNDLLKIKGHVKICIQTEIIISFFKWSYVNNKIDKSITLSYLCSK